MNEVLGRFFAAMMAALLSLSSLDGITIESSDNEPVIVDDSEFLGAIDSYGESYDDSSCVLVDAEQDYYIDYSQDEEEIFDDSDTTEAEENIVTDLIETEEPSGIYTISYVALENDAYNLPLDDNLYGLGDTAYIPYTEPKRYGYTFWGWSLTADNDCVFTAGWNFEVTGDMVFYATWIEDETVADDDVSDYTYTSSDNKVVKAINDYVNSLKGRFNPKYYYKKQLKSIQCCAFTDEIWRDVFGISRYDTNRKFTIINSKKKLKGSEIYQFLKDNNAAPGDIIWVHDPTYAEKYNITHYMMIMGYDKNSLTITDGYEKNGKGYVWKNNQKVSFTGDHSKYFSGKCYVRLYHINDGVTPIK